MLVLSVPLVAGWFVLLYLGIAVGAAVLVRPFLLVWCSGGFGDAGCKSNSSRTGTSNSDIAIGLAWMIVFQMVTQSSIGVLSPLADEETTHEVSCKPSQSKMLGEFFAVAFVSSKFFRCLLLRSSCCAALTCSS